MIDEADRLLLDESLPAVRAIIEAAPREAAADLRVGHGAAGERGGDRDARARPGHAAGGRRAGEREHRASLPGVRGARQARGAAQAPARAAPGARDGLRAPQRDGRGSSPRSSPITRSRSRTCTPPRDKRDRKQAMDDIPQRPGARADRLRRGRARARHRRASRTSSTSTCRPRARPTCIASAAPRAPGRRGRRSR